MVLVVHIIGLMIDDNGLAVATPLYRPCIDRRHPNTAVSAPAFNALQPPLPAARDL